MKSIILSTFAAAAMLALSPTLVSAAAKECRATIYQGANAALLTGRYKDIAKDNAVISWGARVLASIGPEYADWGKAINKSYRCVKRNGRYKCTARAQPCKL